MSFTCKQAGRLDIAMSEVLQMSRNQIERFIKTEGVFVDSKLIKKPGFKLKGGEDIEYDFKEATKSEQVYEVDFDIEVLYEDKHLMVINKPPFLTVHPAPSVKEATLVDWLKKRGVSLSTISGEERHGIVHRIDKETSGALVVAKSNEAHKALAAQLEDKSMGRYYLALIDLPLKEDIIIQKPIARNPKNRLKMAVVAGGKEAKSAFCKLALSRDEKKELIAAKLFTGRTHQIRVHLHALSRHILGDSLYGFKSQNSKISRIMLHASILYLRHPVSKEPLHVHAPLFDDFSELLTKYFNEDEINEKINDACISKCFSTVDKWV